MRAVIGCCVAQLKLFFFFFCVSQRGLKAEAAFSWLFRCKKVLQNCHVTQTKRCFFLQFILLKSSNQTESEGFSCSSSCSQEEIRLFPPRRL